MKELNFNQEIFKNREGEEYDRISFELRMPFQKLVFEKMGIENDVDRVLTDGKIISDYIDNIKNVKVRELILEKKFDEAADLVIEEIQEKENLPNNGDIEKAA